MMMMNKLKDIGVFVTKLSMVGTSIKIHSYGNAITL